MISFKQAVRTCIIDKYMVFRGRAPRSEFWWFVLFQALVAVASIVLYGELYPIFMGDVAPEEGVGALLFLGGAFFFLPNLAVTVRRLHDIGLSGWWYGLYWFALFVALMPPLSVNLLGDIVTVALFVATLWPGTRGHNRFGEDPLNR